MTVRSPDGALVVALKRQLPDRRVFGEVINPNEVSGVFDTLNDQGLSVRR